MSENKISPHAKTERRLLMRTPKHGGLTRLMDRAKYLDKTTHPPLPHDYFLKDLESK